MAILHSVGEEDVSQRIWKLEPIAIRPQTASVIGCSSFYPRSEGSEAREEATKTRERGGDWERKREEI